MVHPAEVYMSGKQASFLVLVILFTLLLRDLPYFNVIVIGKMWIVYLLLFLALFLSRVRMKITTFYGIIMLLFGLALAFSIFALKFFSETIGIILYFSLWIVWGVKMWSKREEHT